MYLLGEYIVEDHTGKKFHFALALSL